jgi:YegS/Rv2252/BmrU family lipid kinase
MATKHCFLIVNPTAGQYAASRIEKIMTALRGQGWSPELLLTGGVTDAARFAQRICAAEEAPFIIAGGGDGTVNGVLNGLAPGRATLGILPLGTANVLAKELKITSLEDAVQKILRVETRPFSVGLLEAQGIRKYFILMAGIGLDGAVVEEVRLGEKKVFGKGAYFLAALRRLLQWEMAQVEIMVDGRSLECHGAIVCNGAKYGGDFVLAPAASIFAPGFQVLCVRDGRRRAYLQLMLNMLAGRLVNCSAVQSFPARELVIGGNKAVQVDGDYCCHGPLRITAVENFARVIV